MFYFDVKLKQLVHQSVYSSLRIKFPFYLDNYLSITFFSVIAAPLWSIIYNT